MISWQFICPCMQVKIWRRSFDVPPPAMESEHPYYSAIREDPRYSGVTAEEFPSAESLKLTIQRTLPYWDQVSCIEGTQLHQYGIE